MNKEEILEKLKELPFEKSDYIILSGASLVLQDIEKETNDIDMAISDSLYDKITDSYNKKIGALGKEIIYFDCFEMSNYLYDLENIVNVNGYNCASISSILKIKKFLNRKKDEKIIKKLELELAKTDNYLYEKDLISNGVTLIAGVDEVGRGPLVGPVVAAAVILPLNFKLDGLTDSKKLSEKKRNEFDKIIKENAISYAIAEVSNEVIDEVNIYEATKIAMKTAIEKLNPKPEHILIDAMHIDTNIPQTSIIKGDFKSLSIAAASVLAKVYRDNLMYELDKKYPYYNYKKNKGYPTKEHIEALYKYGTLSCYRKSYNPVPLINKVNEDEI